MTLENPAAQARPASIPKPTKTGKDKGVLRRGVGPGISVLIKGFCDGVGVPGVPQSPPDKRVLRCGACPESTSSGPDKGFCDGSAERFQELQIRFPNTGTGFEAEETRDFKILNGRVTMRSCAGSAAGHAMQPAEF